MAFHQPCFGMRLLSGPISSLESSLCIEGLPYCSPQFSITGSFWVCSMQSPRQLMKAWVLSPEGHHWSQAAIWLITVLWVWLSSQFPTYLIGQLSQSSQCGCKHSVGEHVQRCFVSQNTQHPLLFLCPLSLSSHRRRQWGCQRLTYPQ